jgi:hypothetical protein
MPLAYCGGNLTAGAGKNCDDPIVGGVEKLFYIMNRRDLDIQAIKASLVTGKTNIYEDIVFNVANPVKVAYKCTNLVNAPANLAGGTYASRFNKVLSGVLLDDGAAAALFIDQLASKDFEGVAVIEHKFKDFTRATLAGSSSFEIIGLEVPLTSVGQEIKNDPADANSEGGWMFALGTLEPHSRNYWYQTDYATTKNLFLMLDGGSELGE